MKSVSLFNIPQKIFLWKRGSHGQQNNIRSPLPQHQQEGGGINKEREENIGEIVALCDFDEQPAAYDVDKVIEQIEYRRANFDCKLCKYNDDEKTICSEDCSDALIDGLIEIVKGGGVE